MMKRFLMLTLFISLVAGCGTQPAPTATPDPLPQVPDTTDETELVEEETAVSSTDDTDDFTAQREQLIQEGIIGMGITDEAVIEALRRVPRHQFVPDEHLAQAYNNHPLPIGYGQTISQPFIVALMTEAVDVGPADRVLEIGAGSGYQAAVLAELVAEVYTVEIIGPLAELSESRMQQLGYDNVAVKHADGYFGWEEHAPFDAIVVTAAPDHVPQPLVQQLKIGGRMVIPVGPVGGYQTLWLVTRVSEEEVRTEDLGGVRFVPLTREEE
jgi:protein-L-isoaspartate(D-aspartate) O-methyltransferase